MKWFLCFVFGMFYMTFFCQDGIPLTKTDSLKRDKELGVFLKQLHDAAVSLDTAKLFPLIDENAQVEPMWMDGVYASGKKEFINFWNLRNTKDTSSLWQLLADASQMNGVYARNQEFYIFPRYDPKFEQSSWLVMKDSIPVYSGKDVKSAIVRWLPKGTVIAPWKNYRYGLPFWIKCPNQSHSLFEEKTDEWIQTNGIYIYGWYMGLRYKNGKWHLEGISGFEYLYPKRY